MGAGPVSAELDVYASSGVFINFKLLERARCVLLDKGVKFKSFRAKE